MDYHAWVVTTSGPVECWVVDYSATGLRLEVPEKLEVQSVGALEFRSQYFKYEVLHDSSIGTKRYLGLKTTGIILKTTSAKQAAIEQGTLLRVICRRTKEVTVIGCVVSIAIAILSLFPHSGERYAFAPYKDAFLSCVAQFGEQIGRAGQLVAEQLPTWSGSSPTPSATSKQQPPQSVVNNETAVADPRNPTFVSDRSPQDPVRSQTLKFFKQLTSDDPEDTAAEP